VKVRDLNWNDFQQWAELYYSRYDEIAENPDLGIYLYPEKPTIAQEAAVFGEFMKGVLDHDLVAVVAEEGSILVGGCTVGRRGHHLEDRHIGSLGIAVQPRSRGKGVGTALMRDALQKCQGRFEIVELRVLATNAPALRLYRRFGFQEFGRQPRSFKRGDRYLDDVLMWRSVAAPAPTGASG
jgi:ribosomal protein S18 acetylase RimI-like enzyme